MPEWHNQAVLERACDLMLRVARVPDPRQAGERSVSTGDFAACGLLSPSMTDVHLDARSASRHHNAGFSKKEAKRAAALRALDTCGFLHSGAAADDNSDDSSDSGDSQDLGREHRASGAGGDAPGGAPAAKKHARPRSFSKNKVRKTQAKAQRERLAAKNPKYAKKLAEKTKLMGMEAALERKARKRERARSASGAGEDTSAGAALAEHEAAAAAAPDVAPGAGGKRGKSAYGHPTEPAGEAAEAAGAASTEAAAAQIDTSMMDAFSKHFETFSKLMYGGQAAQASKGGTASTKGYGSGAAASTRGYGAGGGAGAAGAATGAADKPAPFKPAAGTSTGGYGGGGGGAAVSKPTPAALTTGSTLVRKDLTAAAAAGAAGAPGAAPTAPKEAPAALVYTHTHLQDKQNGASAKAAAQDDAAGSGSEDGEVSD